MATQIRNRKYNDDNKIALWIMLAFIAVVLFTATAYIIYDDNFYSEEAATPATVNNMTNPPSE